MTWTVRISLPDKDCLTSTDPRDYALFADEDNVLIKEFSRGTGNVSYLSDGTITHNLGYIPFFMAFAQVGSSRYRIANCYDPVGSGWRVTAGTDNLVISNHEGTFTGYKYFLFYDNMEGTL